MRDRSHVIWSTVEESAPAQCMACSRDNCVVVHWAGAGGTSAQGVPDQVNTCFLLVDTSQLSSLIGLHIPILISDCQDLRSITHCAQGAEDWMMLMSAQCSLESVRMENAETHQDHSNVFATEDMRWMRLHFRH